MGMLAAAMGLPQGKEGMKKLTQLMKQGKIGMEELFKFLDMAAGRARSTGAYDLAINSKQAAETRMTNSYKLFSAAFVSAFDQTLKGTFTGISDTLEVLTKYFDDAAKEQKETGKITGFKTSVDFLWSVVQDLGSTLLMAAEGWIALLNLLPGMDGKVSAYLANREIDNAYYASQGAKTQMQRMALDRAGRPGYEEFRREQFFAGDAFATDQDYEKFSRKVSGGAGNLLSNINPTSPQFAVNLLMPAFASLMEALKSTKVQTSSEAPPGFMQAPVINIHGVTDPMAVKGVVDDSLKDIFRIPR